MSEKTPDTAAALALLRETVGVEKTVVSASSLPSMSSAGYWEAIQQAWARGDDFAAPLSIPDVLQIAAVMVCLDVISQDIAKTPLYLMERVPGGGKRKVEPSQHPVAGMLVRAPNRHHTWFEFKQMLSLHLGLVQNAFVAKDMDPAGTVREIICVPPWRCQAEILADYSAMRYRIRKDTPVERFLYNGLNGVLVEDEMIHVRMRMMDGMLGYSNMLAGAKTMTLAQELIDFQTRMYRNDGTLRGVFQQAKGGTVEPMDPKALSNLRKQLAENLHALRRHGWPLVLEDGLQFQQISMTADQAELSKARDAAIVDAARTFRIPPHKIYHLVNVKYENMETMESSYAFDTLVPLCEAVEDRLKLGLLSDREQERYFFEFDREVMTITDPAKQAEIIKVMLGMGAMEIDEARARRGLNPLPGGAGKVRLIPTTYMGVDQSNEIVIAAAGVDPAFAMELEDKKAQHAADAADKAAANAATAAEAAAANEPDPAPADDAAKAALNVVPLRG
jgi:HK97 family phage portal protein